ncbi:hypothetical protein OnM2_095039 [Erysiphe neolycopersici]|uniref:HNH nuclease domain-containing protein n=1 Tax=Erysiphe neolycopersici TaxID=212602 RepID=A0A420HB82_9PEZI|nr:hypothetical protein OnM2_095039 [Erysiphe neolycopersici]
MEINFLLTQILPKKINNVNSNFKITKTGDGLELEYLEVDEANAVEEFSKNFAPKPPKISKAETLRLPVKRNLGEGSKGKGASTTSLSEISPAAFNLSSSTDPHGCVITKSSICIASHIIDYAWQKDPYMQGLPRIVKGIINANGINSPLNAILLRSDIDSCFDSKKLSIVPVDEQGLPIPWPLYIETSKPKAYVPASYKLWAFSMEVSSYHLKPVLFEPYILNAQRLPSFPHPVLLQHHFMQSLFLNLKGGGDLTSDYDKDNDGNIVPIWEVSRKTSGMDFESTMAKKPKTCLALDDQPIPVERKVIDWMEGITESDVLA